MLRFIPYTVVGGFLAGSGILILQAWLTRLQTLWAVFIAAYRAYMCVCCYMYTHIRNYTSICRYTYINIDVRMHMS